MPANTTPRELSRRDFLRASGAAVALGALPGCSGPLFGDDGPKQLEYWTSFPFPELEKYFSNNIKAPYNRAHPEATLQVEFKANEQLDRLVRTALTAGEGPDLVQTPGPSYALGYIDAGAVAELDDYAQERGWSDKLLPWALETGRAQGHLYSLPTSYESLAVFYNKQVFEEHGWPLPANRADLEALLEEAAGQGMMPIAAGNSEWKPATEWFVTIFLNHLAGPEAVYQALSGETPWTDPVFVDAITVLRDYFQRGWFGGGVEEYFTNGFDLLYTKLARGQAAIMATGTWAFQEIRPYFAAVDADWDWSFVPALGAGVPQEVFALGIGGTISINAQSDVPEECVTFLDWWYSSTQRQANAVADAGMQPLPVPIAPGEFPANTDERFVRLYTELGKASKEGRVGYTTWTFWPPKSDTYVYEEMEKVLVGDSTPQEYCQGLAEVFEQERADGQVPSLPEPT
jgi:raffinose/stachyose/melibiose transport system substrate-binding protein